ncbi:hypothetical protein Q3C01_43825 [Bradyrhizobium sp. UFLA05-109]
MAAFAVMAPVDNYLLPPIIANKFPKHYSMGPGQWIVAESGITAQQVSERLGINGVAGNFAVFSIAGYNGWYNKNLWEWLAINSG